MTRNATVSAPERRVAGAFALVLALAAVGCSSASRDTGGSAGMGSPGGAGLQDGTASGGAAGGGQPPCTEAPAVVGSLDYGWAQTLGQGNFGGLAVDAAGNAIVTGTYLGTITIGGQTLSDPTAGNHPFLAVLDSSGAVRWARTLPGNWQPYGPALDASGNIYLAGTSYAGTVDLGTGPLPGSLIVAKLGPQGNALWTHSFEAFRSSDVTLATNGVAVAVDAAGDVAVMGAAVGPVDFGGGLPAAAQPFQGFLAVFDTSGVYRFDKSFSSDGFAAAVAFDETGRLLFGGAVEDTLELGGITLPATGRTGFAALLAPTGAPLWGQTFGDHSSARAVAAGADRYLVGGNFEQRFTAAGQLATAVGLNDLFLYAGDGTGATASVATVPTSGGFIGSLALTDDGGSVALISATDVMDLGMGLSYGPGLAVVRTDGQGRTVASAAFSTPYGAMPGTVAVDQSGGIFIGGTFQGALDLGGGHLTAVDQTAPSMFVGRLLQSPGAAPQTRMCPPLVDGALLSAPTPTGEPTAILVRGETVYYTTGTEVMSMPAAGGRPVMLASGQRNVVALAADDQRLYWAAAGHGAYEGLPPDGQIFSIPLAGGPATTLAAAQPWPRALTVDDVNVYWTSGTVSANGAQTTPTDGKILALSKDGTGTLMVVTGGLDTPVGLAAASGWVAFATTLTSGGTGLSRPGTGYSSQISAVARTGGAPVTLALTDRDVPAIATDGSSVFWIAGSTVGIDDTFDDGTINSVPLAGGAVKVLASGQPAPRQMVLVDDQLYWSNAGGSNNRGPANDGGVWQTSTAGGSLRPIISGLAHVQAFGADHGHLVYARSVDTWQASWALLTATP